MTFGNVSSQIEARAAFPKAQNRMPRGGSSQRAQHERAHEHEGLAGSRPAAQKNVLLLAGEELVGERLPLGEPEPRCGTRADARDPHWQQGRGLHTLKTPK